MFFKRTEIDILQTIDCIIEKLFVYSNRIRGIVFDLLQRVVESGIEFRENCYSKMRTTRSHYFCTIRSATQK